ncbi:hypothetical protein SAY86_005257 [Trapa natans]|uniref:Uncharacterized protein n=1 Tax=Trapa natans TaxID=22666 RepID=A0AAN7QR99_TRANT|nr:hypothetical protein SAY86_005257 [Trapa natans]
MIYSSFDTVNPTLVFCLLNVEDEPDAIEVNNGVLAVTITSCLAIRKSLNQKDAEISPSRGRGRGRGVTNLGLVAMMIIDFRKEGLCITASSSNSILQYKPPVCKSPPRSVPLCPPPPSFLSGWAADRLLLPRSPTSAVMLTLSVGGGREGEEEEEEDEEMNHIGNDAALELERMPLASPRWKRNKKWLSKQLSMRETRRDVAWERRRRQILGQERRDGVDSEGTITDEDLNELKGSIELGFGFKEEDGQKLCNTLPALDLYFAVNRQLSPSPVSTPKSIASSSSSSAGSSMGAWSSSLGSFDTWRICNPGDDPQHVKTKLRHWAQAVACSVMQSK